jgi:hypothetical protein
MWWIASLVSNISEIDAISVLRCQRRQRPIMHVHQTSRSSPVEDDWKVLKLGGNASQAFRSR